MWMASPIECARRAIPIAAIGFDTGESEDVVQVQSGFSVRQVHATQAIRDWEDVGILLSGQNVERETVVENVPVINYLDRDRRGHFENSLDFPGGGRTNFALVATPFAPRWLADRCC